jgi:cytochrome c oxidase subunit 2
MRRAYAALSCLGLGGCHGVQNALGGQGAEGANFVQLFTIFMIVCTIMYVLIGGGLLIALWRRRSAPLTVEDRKHHDVTRGNKPLLFIWTVLVVTGLTFLTIACFFTDRSNAAIADNPPLKIKVTANQWWWDIKYSTTDSSKIVRTANELHLPVGVAVQVQLESNDVIHSFWVPNLAGKQDLIPGRVTDIQLLPKKTGLYRGQCAEFCGIDHALMALDITVESKADFQHWYAGQLMPAPTPTSALQMAGYNYFTTRECGGCHNVTGSPASGQVAPDLTHFASRRTIAAGTLAMNQRNIYRWVADPQGQKPGNNMPNLGIAPADLKAVTAYLETLR